MFVLFRLLTSKYLWAGLVLIAAGFLLYGFYINYERSSSSQVRASELLDTLASQNPAAHRRMQALASQYGAAAVNSGSVFYEELYQQSAFDALARDLAPGSTTADSVVQLASLSLAGRGLLSHDAQNYLSLLAARCADAGLSAAQRQIMEAYTAQFIRDQQRAQSEGGRTWEAVCQHPFSIEIYRTLRLDERTESPRAWEYYRERAAWLGDALLMLSLYDVQDMEHDETHSLLPQVVTKDYIELCERYPSMAAYTEALVKRWQSESRIETTTAKSKEIIPSEELVAHIPLIYAMYRDYGDAIESIQTQTQAPPSECVDVLLANIELYEKAQHVGGESRFIQDVVSLYKKDKNVWVLIGMESNALLIYQLHREKARDILAQYSPDGITHLIINASRDELSAINPQSVHNGIEAVARYKEIALYVLEKYGSDHRFEQVLARDFRAIAYLALHEEEGMNHLSSEDWRGYLDKELTGEGEPKQGHWLEYFPGGALYRMAENIQQGYPLSWDELGWAGVEVAEIGFAVASFGSSTVVTTAGKSAVKVSVKSTAKTGSHALHRAALRGRTRTEAAHGFERALSLRGTSRLMAGKLLSSARGGTSAVWRIGRLTFRPIVFIARGLSIAWRVLPPSMQRPLFRLSALSLVSVELYYRTWPHRGAIMEGFSQSLARATSDVIAGSIPMLKEGLVEGTGGFLELLHSEGLYIIGIFLFALFALYLFFKIVLQARFSKKTI